MTSLLRQRIQPLRGLLPWAAVLLAACAGTGCARDAIRSERKQSAAAYRRHLAAVSAADQTPEQAKRTQALRAELMRDLWVERGYRFGNDRGSASIPYTAAAKGWRGLTWVLFDLPQQVIAFSRGDNPARAVRGLRDDKSPDARRNGIADLIRWDFAQEGAYLRQYQQTARNDPDPLVRAKAIRALSRARDADARPLFIEALRDASPVVRVAAATALARLPDPAAAGPLVALVTDTSQESDVRIAAAAALRHHRTLEVARALIPRLGERDFGVAWEARRSLRTLFRRDFRYDEAAWLAHITGPESPLG